jgi:cytoskeletal protein CcmA (bactofilin family)
MFSSKPKDTLPSSTPASAVSTTPAPQRRPARSSAPSILSADAVVTGTLTSVGDMQVDGRVEGDIRSIGLVIGEKAEIHGEIYAEEVTVRGRVIGRILARKVLLCATSHVEGDILHEAFAVESGAFFEGNCRHSDNPLGDAQPAAPLAAVAMPEQSVITPASRVETTLPGQATFATIST